MSFSGEKEGRSRRKPDADSEAVQVTSPQRRKKKKEAGEVGETLRSAYQRMVAEDIPPEMLDLLGKLG